MRKGLAYQLVANIILALIAIILIWYFHEKIFSFMKGVLLEGLKGFIKSILPGPLKWIVR